MKTRYFIESPLNIIQTRSVWRKIGNKIEYMDYSNPYAKVWTRSMFRTLKELKDPIGTIIEVTFEELALAL